MTRSNHALGRCTLVVNPWPLPWRAHHVHLIYFFLLVVVTVVVVVALIACR
jgi:hypothetical protein